MVVAAALSLAGALAGLGAAGAPRLGAPAAGAQRET